MKRLFTYFIRLIFLFIKSFQYYTKAAIALIVRNWLRKLCEDREIVVSTNFDFKMAVSPHDYTSYDIFFFGDYDPSATKIITNLVRPGQTVWDLGANIGWFTLLMGKIVGENGRVDAFEAFPDNYVKLERNIKRNNMDWITSTNLAVSRTEGRMWFKPPSDEIVKDIFLRSSSGFGYLTSKRKSKSIKVRTITLDGYTKLKNISHLDLIKIDIEGSEYDALVGGKKTITKFKPVIIIEYNKDFALRSGHSVEQLDRLLNDYGYDRYIYDNYYLPIKYNKAGKIDYQPGVFNVYAFPRES